MNKTMMQRDLTTMTLQQIVQDFRVNSGAVEVRDKVLRHKRTLAAAGGVTQLIFFKESTGSQGYTLQETNMEEVGKLASGKMFLLEGFELLPFAKAATEANRLLDLVELLNTGVVSFDYLDKPRFEDGPLIHFVASTSLIGVDATTGDGGKHHYMLRNPILIEEGKQFGLRVTWPGAGGSPALTADVDLDWRLIGQEIETGAR